MALKATVYRAELEVADIERGYYQSHQLVLARHPSETEERLMVRLLAFALHAAPDLAFGRGLSTDDEPDLWRKDATGEIELWIDVGLPDERRLRRAAGRAREVRVLAYGARGLDLWWRKNADAFARVSKLSVYALGAEQLAGLARLADRAMRLQCTIQEGQALFASASGSALIEPRRLP